MTIALYALLAYLAVGLLFTLLLIFTSLGDELDTVAPDIWSRLLVFLTFPYGVVIGGFSDLNSFWGGCWDTAKGGTKIIFYPLLGETD